MSLPVFHRMYRGSFPLLKLCCRKSVILRNIQNLASQVVLVSEENGVRYITLNNPTQRNVLSYEVLQTLEKSLQVKTAEKLHCIVLKASGTVFSAGHDLKELTPGNRKNHLNVFNLCSKVMLLLKSTLVPVIAQVNGHAAAAGCQLVASCDIVVAAKSAKFSTPGINVGLFCSTPGIALARAVPQKIAAYMLFTGKPITAEEASQCGLVSRLVPDDKLEEEVDKIVKAISEKSIPVQALGKRFLYRQIELPLDEAYQEGATVMADNLTLVDTQNGIDAFAKKQTVQWTHTSKRI